MSGSKRTNRRCTITHVYYQPQSLGPIRQLFTNQTTRIEQSKDKNKTKNMKSQKFCCLRRIKAIVFGPNMSHHSAFVCTAVLPSLFSSVLKTMNLLWILLFCWALLLFYRPETSGILCKRLPWWMDARWLNFCYWCRCSYRGSRMLLLLETSERAMDGKAIRVRTWTGRSNNFDVVHSLRWIALQNERITQIEHVICLTMSFVIEFINKFRFFYGLLEIMQLLLYLFIF